MRTLDAGRHAGGAVRTSGADRLRRGRRHRHAPWPRDLLRTSRTSPSGCRGPASSCRSTNQRCRPSSPGACPPQVVSARCPRSRRSARSMCCPGSPMPLGEHPSIAHCCHAAAPLRLFRAAGFDALSVDMTHPRQLRRPSLDPIGEAVETGAILLAGTVPSVAPAKPEAPLKTWADADPADLGPVGLPARAVGPQRCSDTGLWAGRRGPGVGVARHEAQPRNWPRRCRISRKAGEPAAGIANARGLQQVREHPGSPPGAVGLHRPVLRCAGQFRDHRLRQQFRHSGI